MSDNNNNEKEYHVTLHATGFQSGTSHYSQDSCRAYFFSTAPVGSEEFKQLRQDRIEFFAKQQLRDCWTGYKVGVTEVKAGSKPISRMSPAWDYGHRTEAIFEKIDI